MWNEIMIVIYLCQTNDSSLPIFLRTEFIFVRLISMKNILAATEEILSTAHLEDSANQIDFYFFLNI